MTRGIILGIMGCLLLSSRAWCDDLVPTETAPAPKQQAEPAPANGETAPQEKPADPKTVSEFQKQLERNAQEIKALKDMYAQEMERQKKQAELQQKQIDVLERAAKLLAEQLKSQPPPSAAVEALETKAATLEARARQAARRDEDLADRAALLSEKVDRIERTGATLPAQLKQLFLPSGTNETPLSIYGQILGSYTKFNGQNGSFASPSIGPWFLIQLNKKFLLEANFDISNAGVSLPQAHLDWFVGNSFKIMAGRFLTPIGFFNERLGAEWINKLPDVPLMFNQVSPATSTDGLQIRGSSYIAGSPLKLEYSGYFGNGFQLAQRPTNLTQTADLQGILGAPDEVSSRSAGGRLGFWYPELGIMGGVSGYSNGIYAPSRDHFNLWGFDLNYHRGNWDFRSEFAQVFQQADAFIGHNISRQGMYAQLAYRDYVAQNKYLRNVELVGRYGYTYFRGISQANLDLTQFGSPLDAPVNRNQYTFGINYYFYPSNVIKFAYEINQELGRNLHDDVFYAQWVWAF